MALVAQLSDAHLLALRPEARGVADWARLAFLSSYRPATAASRAGKLERALARCVAAGADHVVFTGDLTEDAAPAQFDAVCELVGAAGLAPSQVTFVPGNHDAYRGRAHYAEVARTKLAAVGQASGDSFSLDGVRVLPLDSTLDQHFVRAAGRLGGAQRDSVAGSDALTLVLQHHPPLPHALPGLGWFQELDDVHEAAQLVALRASVYVLHGHVHRARDLVPPGSRTPRVFSPRAVVESDDAVRFYEVDARGVRPVAGP